MRFRRRCTINKLALSLFFLSIECSQQAFEALFILLWVGPVLEVPNVPGALDLVHPYLSAGQGSPIYSYRIEDIWDTLWLFIQCLFHFVFNPCACNGVFRQNQQQFVIQSDRLINAVSDFIPDVHILWCKPAAYTFLLQVIMQPSCKQFILARIANEASVVLNGFSEQRMSILNQVGSDSCTFEKDFWYFATRFFKGASADMGWPEMAYGFQPFHIAQIDISEMCLGYDRTAEVSKAEAGSAEVGSFEVGVSEVGSFEIGVSEVGTHEGGSVEMGTHEVGPVEVGTHEVGSTEIGSTEIGSTEIGSTELDSAEIGSTEIGSDEVNRCSQVLLSPGVPCLCPPLENIKLFLLCHTAFSLS